MDGNYHIYLPVLFPDIGPFKSEWLIPLWNNLGLCPFQLGMAHSTVELPNLFQIGTTHSTVPLTHTFQDIAPSAVELSSAISGHRPFQIGMAHSTVLGYCPFQLCFRILPLSLLFQDIAPLNSVSGYCPLSLFLDISPFNSVSGYCPFQLCFWILSLSTLLG